MIITIGRQLGSGGSVIGKCLAETMDLAYYDKEILEITARESGLSQKLFEKADERTQKGIPTGFLGMRFPFAGEGGPSLGLSNEMLFRIQSDVIRSLADRRPSIFIGRCADYILRERTDLMSVFISADADDRIRRIAEKNNISPDKARDMMESIDKKRAAFYNYYTNKTWGMASSYDFCFNSSRLDIDKIISVLKDIISKRF